MAIAGAVWVDVLPDMSKFGSAMRKGVTPGAAAAGAGAGKSFGDAFQPDVAKGVRGSAKKLEKDLAAGGGKAGKKFGADFSDQAGGSLKKFVGVAAGAFAGLQVGSFFASAVQGASDLNETMSKTDVVFGRSAGEIHAWAQNAATSMGQSRKEALASASSFGLMFDQIGFGDKDVVKMSTSMTGLASDLASFNNADITDVIAAQSAAFRGEYDSVQRFVPTINAAAVQQEALKMGLAKTTKELTAQDKAQATYALLMKGTTAAQGDFAKTSNNLANQQRILAKKWEDGKDALGNFFLPAITSVANYITDTVIPGFREFGEWVQRNSEWLIPLAGAIAGLGVAFGISTAVTALGVAIAGAGGFAAFATGPFIALWAAITGPVFLVVAGILALGAAFVYAYKKSDTFRDIVDRAWSGIKKAAMAAWDGYLKPALEAMWRGMQVAGQWAMRMWNDYVRPAFQQIGALASWLWQNAIKPAFGFVVAYVKTMADVFMWLWRNIIGPAFRAIGSIIKVWWGSFVRPILGVVMAMVRQVAGVFMWLWKNITVPVFRGIGKVIGFVWTNVIRPHFEQLKKAVGTIAGAFGTASEAIGRAWSSIKEKTRGPIQYVVDVIYNNGLVPMWNRVVAKFGGEELKPFFLGGGGQKMQRRGIGINGQFAKGGLAPRGWSLVGEEGPELINFTNPGRVYTAEQTTEMMGGFGGPLESIKSIAGFGAGKALSFLDGPLGNIRQKIAAIGATEYEQSLKGMANKAVQALMAKAKDTAAAMFAAGTAPSRAILAMLGDALGITQFPLRGGFSVGMPPEWRGGYRGHRGADYPGPTGLPIYAPFSGFLQNRVLNGSYGMHQNLFGPGGLRAILAHQSGFAHPGGIVTAGTHIGFLGSTGNSTGPHLHYELRRGGSAIDPRAMHGNRYDNGGILPPGVNLTYNGTGGPEAILTRQQWATMHQAATTAPSVQVFIEGREIESAVVRVSNSRDQAMTNSLAYGQV